ncbi:MAG: hypothetical protein IPG76_22620 [Acidobacteria bacterium]|nr:hypothetical protein [Acidobacteriota bacterium]
MITQKLLSRIYLRLQPGHQLTLKSREISIRKYWELPFESEILKASGDEYVSEFARLLDLALKDRLRTERVGLFLSGGIDSGAVASAAKRAGPHIQFNAFTIVYDELMPDRERYYSGLTAKYLGIPINYQRADHYCLYQGWNREDFFQPEPYHAPLLAVSMDRFKIASSFSRVFLTGEGGDAILRPSVSYLAQTLRRFQFGRLIKYGFLHIKEYGRLPRIGIRTRYRHNNKGRFWFYSYPDWIDRDFEIRTRLIDRWHDLNLNPPLPNYHRPEAHQIFIRSLLAVFVRISMIQAQPAFP